MRYAHRKSERLSSHHEGKEYTLADLYERYEEQYDKGHIGYVKRQRKLFTELWGDKLPRNISRADWNRFVEDRISGRIDCFGKKASGNTVIAPVTAGKDLIGLRACLNWAVKWNLLDKNPVQGYPIPTNKVPHQPVRTEKEYRQLLEVADEVPTNGDCFLKDLIILANHTGRRIGSILRLHAEDVDFERGGITWREDNDKLGHRWHCPAKPEVIEVLRKRVKKIKKGPLYSDKIHTRTAYKWLYVAENKVGIPHKGWHSFRRKWVGDHGVSQETAYLGGWKNVVTMSVVYDKPDWQRMEEALNGTD